MNTPVSAIVWVSVGSFIGSLGAVGLKAGSKHVELNLKALLTNWKLALGIGGYLISVLFYMTGISKGEISVLFPMVSIGYAWTMLWSKLFFGESMTRAKFAGLGLILVGCVLLGLGKR
ncbi:MAG TPA: EamA family transporter [Bryobacteraceae bacterium]|nr:EamA family transporter [Bryobacteraceae bacterium]